MNINHLKSWISSSNENCAIFDDFYYLCRLRKNNNIHLIYFHLTRQALFNLNVPIFPFEFVGRENCMNKKLSCSTSFIMHETKKTNFSSSHSFHFSSSILLSQKKFYVKFLFTFSIDGAYQPPAYLIFQFLFSLFIFSSNNFNWTKLFLCISAVVYWRRLFHYFTHNLYVIHIVTLLSVPICTFASICFYSSLLFLLYLGLAVN